MSEPLRKTVLSALAACTAKREELEASEASRTTCKEAAFDEDTERGETARGQTER